MTAEKGTSEFLGARKEESGSTWDVTNMFIKRGDFVLLYKGLSLARRGFHSEGQLGGPRSSQWVFGSRGAPAQLQAE